MNPRAAMPSDVPGTGPARRSLVVGLGVTGLSCARHLAARGHALAVTDSRPQPPGLDALREAVPDADIRVGGFAAALLDGVQQVVVSPGVSLDEPIVVAARERGLPVLGDIELFVAEARAPIVAITGSNGKSTVTCLLAAMLAGAGKQVRAGGNLGTPALSLLGDSEPDWYVLELSSFQLERTWSLHAGAAVVLNVSADHMDRHSSLAAYAAAKATVYRDCRVAVVNRDEPDMMAMARIAGPQAVRISFGLDAPAPAQYGLLAGPGGARFLARGDERLLALDALAMRGMHNVSNALAALALAEATGTAPGQVLATLAGFGGLPHRCQRVATVGGVEFVDDSKGTNVGAAVAAVRGFTRPIVLIAGGLGKGADFAPLAAALAGRGRAAVLIGRDGPRLGAALAGVCPIEQAAGMDEAVARAAALARDGDIVLLSPACASQDMFEDYRARGDAFAAAVQGLAP